MAEVEDGDGGGDEDGVENEDEEYEAEQIVSKNVHRGKALYLVRWKGYSGDDDSWEPLEHLTSCRELVEAFEECERDRSLSRTIGLGLRHS